MHTAIPVTLKQVAEILKESFEFKDTTGSPYFQVRFHQRWHYFQIVPDEDLNNDDEYEGYDEQEYDLIDEDLIDDDHLFPKCDEHEPSTNP